MPLTVGMEAVPAISRTRSSLQAAFYMAVLTLLFHSIVSGTNAASPATTSVSAAAEHITACLQTEYQIWGH